MLDFEDLRIFEMYVVLENIWKHHTCRMLDIEDVGIYEILYRFWDYVDTSRPQDVGYLGFKDI